MLIYPLNQEKSLFINHIGSIHAEERLQVAYYFFLQPIIGLQRVRAIDEAHMTARVAHLQGYGGRQVILNRHRVWPHEGIVSGVQNEGGGLDGLEILPAAGVPVVVIDTPETMQRGRHLVVEFAKAANAIDINFERHPDEASLSLV